MKKNKNLFSIFSEINKKNQLLLLYLIISSFLILTSYTIEIVIKLLEVNNNLQFITKDYKGIKPVQKYIEKKIQEYSSDIFFSGRLKYIFTENNKIQEKIDKYNNRLILLKETLLDENSKGFYHINLSQIEYCQIK